jgi:hypothetical protein
MAFVHRQHHKIDRLIHEIADQEARAALIVQQVRAEAEATALESDVKPVHSPVPSFITYRLRRMEEIVSPSGN